MTVYFCSIELYGRDTGKWWVYRCVGNVIDTTRDRLLIDGKWSTDNTYLDKYKHKIFFTSRRHAIQVLKRVAGKSVIILDWWDKRTTKIKSNIRVI